MKEIIEIYTKSQTFNHIGEIMKEVTRIRKHSDFTIFEEMARYVCEWRDGKNILVELQVSTKAHRDLDLPDFIDITAYSFEGDISDFSADIEIETISFNGNWKTAIDQMKSLALKIIKEDSKQ